MYVYRLISPRYYYRVAENTLCSAAFASVFYLEGLSFQPITINLLILPNHYKIIYNILHVKDERVRVSSR